MLRYYFAVNNRYVLKKMLILLFPFRKTLYGQKGRQSNCHCAATAAARPPARGHATTRRRARASASKARRRPLRHAPGPPAARAGLAEDARLP